jgi:pyruvate dehydrogenase E2 component (dihydrolipoamide acetyltransferase)
VQTALQTIAAAWFPGGRQAVELMPALAASSVPIQVLWGRDDRIIPVMHAEALSSRVPVHILEQAGHLLHMEKARDVARLIGRFIENPASRA